jgi:tetratricopeptide (TPR) repeat protein
VLVLGLLVLAATDPAGLAAWTEGRFSAAEAAFRRALQRRPSDAMTRLYLARTLLDLNRVPEALAEIRRALTGPVAAEVRLEAGRLLRHLAERRLAQLEALAPDSPATLELEGARLEWAGQLDEALAKYRAAAARDMQRPGIHYRIGNILWRTLQVEAASAEIRQELALTPQHGMANLRMGQILMQSGSAAGDAIPFFERALTAMPGSLEARREAGKAYHKAGRTAEARAHWEAVAEALPDDDQIHYLLSRLYRELGETARAKRELELHRGVLDRRRPGPLRAP